MEKVLKIIDLNADVGESFGRWSLGDDAALMGYATSVNIACGFHAGDPSGIRQTCSAAATAGVQVGAHPSYRDLAGFGRRFIEVDPHELRDEIIYQIGALKQMAAVAGTEVSYVKPHGALYNAIVHHSAQAQAVVDAVLAVDPTLPLLVLPNSEVAKIARTAGLRVVAEAFADRGYQADGTLLPRNQPGAVLDSVEAVIAQCLDIAVRGQVSAVDGGLIPLDVQSICLHGDTPGALTMARAVSQALTRAGVNVTSFR